MDDLVAAADLRVLVVQGVEAVRTRDDDLALGLFDTLEHTVEDLDVLLRQLLEQELVARAASGVTGAGLLGAEHHELGACGREELGDGLRRLLRAVLVGTGTSDPEQVLVAVEALGVLTEHRDLEIELVDPVETVLGVLAPGVALVLEVLEQAGQLGREVRLDEHLITAHIDDVVDVLDVDGALLDACTTVGAAPQGLRVDHRGELAGFDHLGGFADEFAAGLGERGGRDLRERGLVRVAFGVDETDLVATEILATAGEQVRRLRLTVVAQRHDEQFRRQRLTGVPGGALRLAATALGARGEVQPALPGEVLDAAGAERVVVGVRVLHVDGLALRHHGLDGAEGDIAVVFTLEVDVEEGGEPVPGDTPVDVAADDVEPHHARHQLDEREDRHHDRARGQQLREVHGEEVGGHVTAAVGGDLAGLHEDHAEALDEDDELDEVRGLEVRAGEP